MSMTEAIRSTRKPQNAYQRADAFLNYVTSPTHTDRTVYDILKNQFHEHVYSLENGKTMLFMDSHTPEERKRFTGTTILAISGVFQDPRKESVLSYGVLSGSLSHDKLRVVIPYYAQLGGYEETIKSFPRFLDDIGVTEKTILSGNSLGGILEHHLLRQPEIQKRVVGAIFSHTAPPDAKHFSNLQYRGLVSLKAVAKRLPWNIAQPVIDKMLRRSGVEGVSVIPKDERNRRMLRVAKLVSASKRGELQQDVTLAFLDIFTKTTRPSRRGKGSETCFAPWNGKALILMSVGDNVMPMDKVNGLMDMYPNARVVTFNSEEDKKSGHHTPSVNVSEFLHHMLSFIAICL